MLEVKNGLFAFVHLSHIWNLSECELKLFIFINTYISVCYQQC